MKKYLPILLLLFVSVIFFYQTFIFFKIPFPGDLLVSEYSPWKYDSFLGYNPGSYPNKAQYFDVIRQLYPWKILAMDLWKSGNVPLWNPYNFSGSPLLANNQSGVFYPLNLIFFLSGQGFTWAMYIFMQPFLASVFMFIFIKSLKRSNPAALIAAVSYGFSLFMSTFLEYGNIGHTILWLPLLLLSVEKIKSKKYKYAILLSLATCFTLFAGHLQIASSVILFSLFYLFATSIGDKKTIIVSSLFTTLGVLMASIQLIPTLELLLNSARDAHSQQMINNLFLLLPQQLILLFAPDTYGNPATRNYLLTDTYPGNAIYIGIVPLLFAMYAIIFGRKDKFVKVFSLIAVGLLVLFVSNPISIFIFNLSIFSASSPSNFFYLLGFSLSVLCAYGVDVHEIPLKKTFLVIGIVITLPILLFLMHLLFHTPVNSKQFIVSVVIILLSSIAFILFRSFKKQYVWVLPFLVLTIDLFYFFIKFNPFVPKSLLYPKTEIVSYIQNNLGTTRFLGIEAASIESNFSTQFRTYSPDGYDPLYPKNYNVFTKSVSRSDVIVDASNNNMLSDLSVGYVLDRVENGSDEKSLPPNIYSLIYSQNSWKLFKNNKALPRSYVVENNKIIKANILSYSPDKVVIQNESGAGRLVLTDTFYPGWEAKIDGRIEKITPYKNIFKSVHVTKGLHTVVFEYKPKSFTWGVIITIISSITMIIFYVGQRKISK